MIRPWYRSRLFWLGIPGLLFLLWAWIGSIMKPMTARFYPSPQSIDHWELASGSGAIRLWHAQYAAELGPHWDPPPRFGIQADEVSPNARGWFPHRPFYLRNSTSNEPIKTHHHFSWYAYWFLLLLYVLPWASCIGFRQRRKMKYLKA